MESEGDHTGNEEEEYGQKFEIGTEDSASAAFFLILAREYTLNDELVGTPIPEADHGRADEGAEPRILGVAVVADKVCHGVAIFIYLHRRADTHHLIPTAEFLEAEHKDDKRAEEKNGCLEH